MKVPRDLDIFCPLMVRKPCANTAVGRRKPAPVQHRRPEQRVEIADVLADEVVELGGGLALPVLLEVAPCARARPRNSRYSRSAHRTRRRSTCPARRGSRCRSTAHRARCPSPAARRRTTRRAWRAPRPAGAPATYSRSIDSNARAGRNRCSDSRHTGRRAADDRDRIDQLGGRVGRAADLAGVAVLVRGRAARAGAACT